MGELQRSAEMVYLQVIIPKGAAESFANEMCRRDIMMFVDLNENVQMFNRTYVKDITRINETERALANIQSYYREFGLCDEDDFEVSGPIMNNFERRDIVLYDLTDKIQSYYRDLAQQVLAARVLAHDLEKHKDQLEVLNSLDSLREHAPRLQQARGDGMNVPLVVPENQQSEEETFGFKYLAGVCPVVKLQTLNKQIFHITRGNRYFRHEMLADGKKAAFVVYFIGNYVRNMIKKFCSYMDVEIFLDSTDNIDYENLKGEVEKKIREKQNILRVTNKELSNTMDKHKQSIIDWNIILKQEMAIRVLLNKFDNISSGLRAEGWVAKKHKHEVNEAVELSQVGSQKTGYIDEIAGKGVKPTYFETNSFTEAFQLIIDTYGVPRHGEYNPTVPSIVTFPFLFAVMYGDVFHGGFLLLGALWFVLNAEKNAKSKNEFIQGLHEGRYMLLLMGIFAVFNGLIYNDVTSISINGFNGQQWEDVSVKIRNKAGVLVQTNIPQGRMNGVYAFGVDPVWSISSDQLTYMNSLKMKLSVIIGISQMTFGLFLRLSNDIHERNYLNIWTEFIPQLMFLVSFFNYMQFIIIYKWCTDWQNETGRIPPSLITILVNLVLSPGTIEHGVTELYDKGLQESVQLVCVLMMVVSIPWMLLIKPFVLRSRHRSAQARQLSTSEQNLVDHIESQDHGHGGHGHGHGEEFEFSEVFIHQIIETIEYVLGTVSNTASYLRLWALSLAHAQLAEVFYEYTIVKTTSTGNGVIAFVGVAAFFAFTAAVLLMMDVLECFLHALRLHWVEFQNKFYHADGVPFVAFSFKSFISE